MTGQEWGARLVTTATAAELVDRDPVTIRQWVARGHLAAVGRRGRSRLFRVRDVLDAERDTRHRARDTRFGKDVAVSA